MVINSSIICLLSISICTKLIRFDLLCAPFIGSVHLKFFVFLLLFDTNLSRSDPKRLASTLSKENEESCTTYNMLKVSSWIYLCCFLFCTKSREVIAPYVCAFMHKCETFVGFPPPVQMDKRNGIC